MQASGLGMAIHDCVSLKGNWYAGPEHQAQKARPSAEKRTTPRNTKGYVRIKEHALLKCRGTRPPCPAACCLLPLPVHLLETRLGGSFHVTAEAGDAYKHDTEHGTPCQCSTVVAITHRARHAVSESRGVRKTRPKGAPRLLMSVVLRSIGTQQPKSSVYAWTCFECSYRSRAGTDTVVENLNALHVYLEFGRVW